MGYYLKAISGQSVAFTTKKLYDIRFDGFSGRIAKVKEILQNGSNWNPGGGTVSIGGHSCYHTHITNIDGIAWRWNPKGLFVAAHGEKGGKRKGSGNYTWYQQ